jgi:hypothetical protein
MLEHALNLPEIEIAKFNDFRIIPVIRRHNLESLFLAFNFYDEPGFMLSIETTPIGMGKKVRP